MHSHVWGLPVALDLFFAGLGAGLFLVAVMADLFASDRYNGVRRVGGVLAPCTAVARRLRAPLYPAPVQLVSSH